MQTARGSDDDARYPDEFPVGKKVHQKEVYLYGLLYNEVVHTLHQAHFLHRHGRCWFVRLLQDSLPEFLRCVRKCLKPVHGNIYPKPDVGKLVGKRSLGGSRLF